MTTDAAARVAELERELLVTKVATAHALPADLAAVLKGATEEELTAHAETLAKYAEPAYEPGELGGGLDPFGPSDEDHGLSPRELAAKYSGRTRRRH